MSPIDDYYIVLDYLNVLEVECGYGLIDNTHKISKHLHALLLLARAADDEHWKKKEEEE